MDYLPELPVTYHNPRGPTVGVGIFVIVLCGALCLMTADTNPIGRWVILVVGVAFGISMIIFSDPRRSYLTLTPEGFEFAGLKGKSFVSWKDVQAFSSYEYRDHSFVTWYYTDEAKARGDKLPKGVGSRDDADGGLPGSFGYQPERLVLLMNDLLGKYGRPSLRNS